MRSTTILGAFGLALAVAGCFDPTPPAGRACGPDMSCPPGQECVADVCVLEGTGGSDAGLDAVPCSSWSSRLFDACDLPVSGADLVITGATVFNSDTRELGIGSDSQPVETVVLSIDGIEVVVVVAGNFTVAPGAGLQLVGARPVVVAAWNRIDVGGTLSAGSVVGLRAAGSNPPEHCPVAVPPLDGQLTGGAGGSSAVASGGAGGSAAQMPGPAATAPSEGLLRGGCDGGATSNASGMLGRGGLGGGAVALSSPGPIDIAGRVLAGGGGGPAGSSVLDTNKTSTGGAGGGAGGHIVIESPSIRVNGAVLAANGGGGGGGASDQTDMNGPGSDALPSLDPAPGGPGTTANVGGSGGATEVCGGTAGGPGVDPNESGGGGGGACGLIELTAAGLGSTDTAIISPPPVLR